MGLYTLHGALYVYWSIKNRNVNVTVVSLPHSYMGLDDINRFKYTSQINQFHELYSV